MPRVALTDRLPTAVCVLDAQTDSFFEPAAEIHFYILFSFFVHAYELGLQSLGR